MKKVLLASLMAASSAFALVERPVDEKQPIAATFSTSSHNRIAVDGGAVEKVFGDSSLFSIAVDSSTGNAFVNVLQEIEEPSTLSVVLSTGAVQDLLVRSTAGPSEHVRLCLPDAEESWMLRHETSLAASVNLLSQILEGSVPAGYGQREWEKSDQLQVPAPLVAMQLKSIEGPFEVISAYEIRNPGKKPVVLLPDELKQERAWIFLTARVLDKDERAVCILGRAKDG